VYPAVLSELGRRHRRETVQSHGTSSQGRRSPSLVGPACSEGSVPAAHVSSAQTTEVSSPEAQIGPGPALFRAATRRQRLQLHARDSRFSPAPPGTGTESAPHTTPAVAVRMLRPDRFCIRRPLVVLHIERLIPRRAEAPPTLAKSTPALTPRDIWRRSASASAREAQGLLSSPRPARADTAAP